jgi:hypothetical protein
VTESAKTVRMVPADRLCDLAREVLAVLDRQQRYWKGGRAHEDLVACKVLEAELRRRCEREVAGLAPPADLFAGAAGG